MLMLRSGLLVNRNLHRLEEVLQKVVGMSAVMGVVALDLVGKRK